MLVHGAFHGPWCWDEVRQGLESQGIRTVAPNLPFTGILDDASEARSAIDLAATDNTPVIVCGHSYGGRVISLAASGHPAVQHLVYLTAVQADETVRLGIEETPTGVMTAFRTRDDGVLYLDAEIAAPYFFHDCDPKMVEAYTAQLRSMSVGPTAHFPDGLEPPVTAWREIPSTYVVCTEDRIIDPTAQRAMASQASDVMELPTGHSPMLAQPGLVVELLAGLATR